MFSRLSRLLSLVSVFSMSLGLASPVEARSPWDMQHPTLPPQQDGNYMPGQLPGQLHTGVPPALTTPQNLGKNFWQGQHPGFVNRIQPGVMLTGILEDEISSGKNKPGDVFALSLEDGFVQNGMQVIPQKSKIVGAITHVVPARTLRAPGQPGSLQVSLQALVLPDGTHIPFAGFIANNPNHAYEKAPGKKNAGFDVKDTGHHIAGMMGSFTNGIGFMYSKKYRGRDFYMDKDDAIPVRLNKTLIIPEQYVRPVGAPPDAPGMNANVPGMSSQLAPVAPGMVPGLTGADPVGQFSPPRPGQPVPGLVGETDPFTIPVNGPTSKPLNEMPEPF